MSTDASSLPLRVLLIDDALSILESCRQALEHEPAANPPASLPKGSALRFSVDSACHGPEGLASVQSAAEGGRPYAIALVDTKGLTDRNAVDTLRHLWAADPRLQVVITGDCAERALEQVIQEWGPSENVVLLHKPFQGIELRNLVCMMGRKWLLAQDVERRVAELDETVRVRTEEAKRAQQGFAEVFNASPLAQSILALDRFEVIAVNSAYEKILGFTAKDLKETTPESFGRGLDAGRWRGLMARLAKGETVDDHPFVYDPPSGGRRDMRCTARALTVLGRPCSIWVIRDVTDQLRLEDQLRQSQKMDAIGQLAAGVAHDFNNLLTVILACTQQAIEDAPNKEMRALLDPVLQSGNRAAALTRQLLVFSRKQALETRLTEVTCLIRDLQAVVRCLMPETAELVWDLPESLPMVLADAGNLEQVIMNLAMNARDALPAKGGRIRIGAGLRNFATAEETGHADGRAGEFVTLQVADNGSGIPPEVLPRIFEPFFTTKAVGKGTGLGLSTVYSIARQHRGWIDIDTAVGRGTTFTIYHPVAEPEEAALAVLGDRPRAPMRVSPTGWGRVLAVDDDSEVQSVMRLVFDRCKIDGVIALDAPSAVNAWDACHGAFDMLVTDVVMPNGPTGIDLARALRQRKPDLKVVIMTGYSSELLKPDSLKMPGRPPRVMLKPFDIVTAINTMASA